jgi:hypothetical protein
MRPALACLKIVTLKTVRLNSQAEFGGNPL